MVESCLFMSHLGGSDVCCEQRGGVVYVGPRRCLFGCVRHCDDGSHVAHGPPLESEDGALVLICRDKRSNTAAFNHVNAHLIPFSEAFSTCRLASFSISPLV